jgi:hypothetical protein
MDEERILNSLECCVGVDNLNSNLLDFGGNEIVNLFEDNSLSDEKYAKKYRFDVYFGAHYLSKLIKKVD